MEKLSLQEVTAAINQLMSKMAGQEGRRWFTGLIKFLRSENPWRDPVVPRWWEKDGVIHFTITSNGMTGAEWVECLERKELINKDAKELLLSNDFVPTKGITTEVAVMKQDRFVLPPLFADVNGYLQGKQVVTCNMENACLILDKFESAELREMGFHSGILIVHQPQLWFGTLARFLLVQPRFDHFECFLAMAGIGTQEGWHPNIGFAVVAVPHVPIAH